MVALAIIVIGWVTAKLVKGLVFRFLPTIRSTSPPTGLGVVDVLDGADIRQSPAELVAVLVYCLVLLGILAAAVSALGLDQVSEVLTRCLVYAPKVVAAVVVLILGLFLASFLAGSSARQRPMPGRVRPLCRRGFHRGGTLGCKDWHGNGWFDTSTAPGRVGSPTKGDA